MEDLSEKEQIDAMRSWWKENGRFVISGIVLGVVILVSWNRWQAHRETTGLEASELFETLAVDVSSIASSKLAAQELIDRGGQIDQLLLNAGIVPGDVKHMSKDGVELGFASSLIGHHIIANELLNANLELPRAVPIRQKVRLSILSLAEPIHVRDFQIPAHLDRVRAQSSQLAGLEANCIG